MIARSHKDLLGNRNIMHSSLNTFLESTTDLGIDSPQYRATEIFPVNSPVNVRFWTVLGVTALNIIISNEKFKNILKTSDMSQVGLDMVPTMSPQGW